MTHKLQKILKQRLHKKIREVDSISLFLLIIVTGDDSYEC